MQEDELAAVPIARLQVEGLPVESHELRLDAEAQRWVVGLVLPAIVLGFYRRSRSPRAYHDSVPSPRAAAIVFECLLKHSSSPFPKHGLLL